MASDSRVFLFFVQFVTLAILFRSAHSSCYLPNGTSPDDKWTAPCSSDPSNPLHSTCCHTQWANPPGSDIKYGPTQDECMSNGLCQNRGSSSIPGAEQAPWTHFYRVQCTDKDFKGCLDVCSTGLNAHDGVQLTPCDGTSTSEKWCCGDTTSCCSPENAYKAVYIPRNFSSSAAHGLPPTPTPNTTSSVTPSVTPNPQGKKLTNGAKAGIVLGTIIGAILFLALGFFLGFLGRRLLKKTAKTTKPPAEIGSESIHDIHAYRFEAESKRPSFSHELGDRRSRAEMGGKAQLAELAELSSEERKR
ncbi:hypothetical protein K505DRAFT_418116 [Melanomma pulvis-pyrius CBS 109.77]|uniref:Uncharacterized protein n=1 Tax=Melanomma pulvis-pyrius CBS 109.77 TaxID=1314802 RepID=A0A6A6X986_9PLEO|nr:hypothetical protein K505DRAFT_418116 [Melanomma pulvis-pyrius CBS 109.77]